MSRPRIVIDTNVLIFAALKPAGLEARLIELVARRAIQLCISEEIIDEYRGVLARAKFAHIEPQRIARLLMLIAEEATTFTPSERLSISRHDDDNRFYECAAAAAADYIVTGNIRHFPRNYTTTKIVTARQFLAQIASDLQTSGQH